MTPIELLANSCANSLELLKKELADFSPAEMLTRPCPGANHAAWQVGHLACSETSMIGQLKPGGMPALPAGFADRFTKQTATKDDPAAFPSKEQLLETLSKARAATVEWIRSLSPADLEKPGSEKMRQLVPTVGHTILLQSTHLMMHLGQIQVIRRKLGKPVLF